ncbi:MAG: hypothetical protein A2144_02125 [Chloroflexi bacterium RBG_16_50_9]|nr:MAG: hypothetical protein A2144_02125 [Chloroflexi bacterium RBG_16_50_9]
MWRNKKLMVILSLVVVLLAGSIGAGVAFAQTGNEGNTPIKTLIARVAEKLGIEEQTLENAFNEARQEMQVEARDRYLDKLITDGEITQEQANQYRAWLDSKPDVQINPRLPGPGMHRGFGGFGGKFFGGWCGPLPPPQPTQTAIQ